MSAAVAGFISDIRVR